MMASGLLETRASRAKTPLPMLATARNHRPVGRGSNASGQRIAHGVRLEVFEGRLVASVLVY